jgi:mannose-6-phosphate isomerase-like protein (cupin superfamily)
MLNTSFEEFSLAVRGAGFNDVFARDWLPDIVVQAHTHSFDAHAVVVRGEMWLTCGGVTQHLGIGDTFSLLRGTPHSERYGPDGATYWVGRREA